MSAFRREAKGRVKGSRQKGVAIPGVFSSCCDADDDLIAWCSGLRCASFSLSSGVCPCPYLLSFSGRGFFHDSDCKAIKEYY